MQAGINYPHRLWCLLFWGVGGSEQRHTLTHTHCVILYIITSSYDLAKCDCLEGILVTCIITLLGPSSFPQMPEAGDIHFPLKLLFAIIPKQANSKLWLVVKDKVTNLFVGHEENREGRKGIAFDSFQCSSHTTKPRLGTTSEPSLI